MPNKTTLLKHTTIYATYLLLVWGLYRVLFILPEEIEEGVVKPILWLVPIIFVLYKEKQKVFSLGLTFKNLFPSIYLALGLGLIFVLEALVTNYFKYNGFVFKANLGDKMLLSALSLSLATAISEEITFRGYLFNRLNMVFENEWLANLITTSLWVLIHVPATIFILKLSLGDAGIYLFLTAIFGLGASFIFARTKNIVSSILLHILWSWPIILFR